VQRECRGLGSVIAVEAERDVVDVREVFDGGLYRSVNVHTVIPWQAPTDRQARVTAA
jgi:hypothetical protein